MFNADHPFVAGKSGGGEGYPVERKRRGNFQSKKETSGGGSHSPFGGLRGRGTYYLGDRENKREEWNPTKTICLKRAGKQRRGLLRKKKIF